MWFTLSGWWDVTELSKADPVSVHMACLPGRWRHTSFQILSVQLVKQNSSSMLCTMTGTTHLQRESNRQRINGSIPCQNSLNQNEPSKQDLGVKINIINIITPDPVANDQRFAALRLSFFQLLREVCNLAGLDPEDPEGIQRWEMAVILSVIFFLCHLIYRKWHRK